MYKEAVDELNKVERKKANCEESVILAYTNEKDGTLVEKLDITPLEMQVLKTLDGNAKANGRNCKSKQIRRDFF